MARPLGPSVGPWQVAEIDIHLVNEIFRQIEEYIARIIGLLEEIPGFNTGTFPGYATATELQDVAATEDAGTETVVTRGDHVHAHGINYLPDAHHVAFETLQANLVDVLLSARKINLAAGTNITLTPSAGQIEIAATGSGGGVSSADGQTLDEAVGDVGGPFDRVLLAEDTMNSYDLAQMDAIKLRALQLVVAGDDLVSDLHELTDGSGRMIYA